jgi:hypothetical protein
MQWLDRWFYRKARWAWKRAGIENPNWKQKEDFLDRMVEWGQDSQPQIASERADMEVGLLDADPHDLNDGLRIDVKHVMGGHVVTVRHPHCDDRKLTSYQEPSRTTYIITEDQDFDHELCKILSIERLKQ